MDDAEAGLFHADPGRLAEAEAAGGAIIDRDSSRLEPFGNASCTITVARPDHSSETIDAVVGKANSFFFALDDHDRDNGTEGLFHHHLHRMVDVCEHRWVIVVARHQIAVALAS